MNELDEIKELLSDVIDEKDFLIPFVIYTLYIYEPDIDYIKMSLLFKDYLMKGYQDEY